MRQLQIKVSKRHSNAKMHLLFCLFYKLTRKPGLVLTTQVEFKSTWRRPMSRESYFISMDPSLSTSHTYPPSTCTKGPASAWPQPGFPSLPDLSSAPTKTSTCVKLGWCLHELPRRRPDWINTEFFYFILKYSFIITLTNCLSVKTSYSITYPAVNHLECYIFYYKMWYIRGRNKQYILTVTSSSYWQSLIRRNFKGQPNNLSEQSRASWGTWNDRDQHEVGGSDWCSWRYEQTLSVTQTKRIEQNISKGSRGEKRN